MSVRERIIALRLIEKERDNKAFFDEIGLTAKMNVIDCCNELHDNEKLSQKGRMFYINQKNK